MCGLVGILQEGQRVPCAVPEVPEEVIIVRHVFLLGVAAWWSLLRGFHATIVLFAEFCRVSEHANNVLFSGISG